MLTKLVVNILLISLINSGVIISIDEINKKQEGASSTRSREEIIKINPDHLGIKISAKGAIVLEENSGKILFEKEKDKILPIASLTKLMSALIFVETNPNWEEVVEIIKEDEREGGALTVAPGETVTIRDLFYSSLVGSANNATVALVRSTGLKEGEFVRRMNEKAKSLGLQKTQFTEPTGLEDNNISTPYEMARLAQYIFKIPEIEEAASTKEYVFNTINTNKKHQLINTNKLLRSFLDQPPYRVIGGKTGFTYEANHCLVTEVAKEGSGKVIAIVLGSQTDEDRFLEVKGLIYWAFENYKFP